MSALHYSSLSQISELLRTKQISPFELVESHLNRISVLQPKLNAFVHLDSDFARAAAKSAAEQLAQNTPLGPLHGIPVTVKSCIEATGWPVPAGSLLRTNEPPSRTAPIIERLRDAGAILLGSTNTPEFLMAYETDNRVSGRTANPWNLAHSSGGSSGGEAAAIASRRSFGGIGSDGGGFLCVPPPFFGICRVTTHPPR